MTSFQENPHDRASKSITYRGLQSYMDNSPYKGGEHKDTGSPIKSGMTRTRIGDCMCSAIPFDCASFGFAPFDCAPLRSGQAGQALTE